MKVLVIRFSSIGDIILSSPVLRCVKEQVADVELHFLTKPQFCDLVRYSPHLDRVHEIGEDFNKLTRELKNEGFDHIIDLHNNARSLRVKHSLGVTSHSFNKLNVQKWLRVNLKVDRLPHIHIVDRYLEATAHLGVKNDDRGLELFIPPDRKVPISSLPDAHQQGFVGVAIGAAHATKRLPARKLVQVVKSLDRPVVLIGGPQDKMVAASIAEQVGGTVFDATGRYDILGSASLIEQAQGVITHDSGAMHIAAAFNKPLVSVWGNTIPDFGMYPYMPQHPERYHIAEVGGLSCRPCSKIGFDQCPRGHFRCMEQQNAHSIVAKLHELMVS